MHLNRQLLVRINLFNSSYFLLFDHHSEHFGIPCLVELHLHTGGAAPSPGGDGDGNEDVGNSSLKTLSPTPGAPARDDEPAPIPDDDAVYDPTPIKPYEEPTGSGGMVGKIVSTMVLGVAAVWFGM